MGDNSLMIQINGSAKDFLDELDKVKKNTKSAGKVLSTTAKASAIAFAGLATAVGLTTREFIKYEKALVGVGKTTNIEGKQLKAFGKQFQKLSEEIPLSTNELLGIAQAAGQLGVTGEENLLKFTDTVAKLGVATDLSGEAAATALTRILNVTHENISTIDTFGSVIVQLGNNFAATESEIVKVANEVARSTAVFGVSASEATAFGAAMKSLGIQAQLGGSVVGKAMLKINEAIDAGGESMKLLSELTGIAGDDLKQTFEEDAAGVFQKFTEGLGGLEGGTSAIFKALGKFKLKGDEVNKVIPVLAKNSQLLGKAFSMASAEVKNATALNIEAEKAYATLGSKVEILKNSAVNLAVKIGEDLAPSVTELVEGATALIKGFQGLDKEVVNNLSSFLKWGTVIAGAIAGVASFALGALKVSGIISALTAAFGPAALGASVFWAAITGPIGIAVAAIVALSAGLYGLYKMLDEPQEPKTIIQLNEELDKLKKKRDELDKPAVMGQFKDYGRIKAINKEIEKLQDLREERVKASADYGTGELLIRPTADTGISLGADAFGIESQEIPFKGQEEEKEEARKKDLDATKKHEKEKTSVIGEETQKRIDELRFANQLQSEINAARSTKETDEEKDAAQRKVEIQAEFNQAKLIKDEEERALSLESLNLKHEEELASIQEFELLKREENAIRREEDAALDDELRALGIEKKNFENAEDYEMLKAKIVTEKDLNEKARNDKNVKLIDNRNQFLKDELEHGKTYANIKSVLRSDDYQSASDFAGMMSGLARSSNKELAGIGKVASLANVAIKTPSAAMSNYEHAAAWGGPVAGAIAAGVAIAYGADQTARILGANTGGMVPNAGALGIDSVPAMLTPGELVVPTKNFNEVIDSVASSRGYESTEGGAEDQTITVVLEPKGDLVDMIEQQIIERQVQRTGLL